MKMKIAFASCSKIQDQKVQPAWKAIEDERPDHLLLLGDNVYSPNLRWSHKKMEKRYIDQFREPHFKSLMDAVPHNAVWDDHDFGPNNKKGAHTSDKKRNKSRDLFHRYMDCSTNLPHVYHSFEKGGVKFIMLDCRYYREKRKRENATIFGVEQEEWLKRELKHEKTFTVVCCGSCLTRGGERLDKYGDSYDSLIDSLRAQPRTLFLSGDIHENDFHDHGGFFEATSSGVGRDDLDNFGLITFAEDRVVVDLRGNKKRDNLKKVIDVATWSLIEE